DVDYAHIYNAVLADSGMYYVQIKSAGGCTKTDSLHVQILGTEDVTAGMPKSICIGSSAQLTSTGGVKYSWTPASGLSDAEIANPIASPQVSTNYVVTVTNEAGCVDTASVRITLLNKIAVKAIISGSRFICKPSDSAFLKDESLGEITKWNWDFGNGMKSSLQNPPVQMYFVGNNTTDYSVGLIVADSVGCADTTTHMMKVENNCYIAVPTAFSPNGDGINDYLYPLNAYKTTDLEFRVFDRTGQLVFETNDWTRKWDGTLKGEPVPSDVYVWMLSYTDDSNKKIFLKGSTFLIR
ncbi:MAG: gliding motility-associated C-terminal domain-containing protein, partial [Ginsengibacter sp.]